MMIDISPIAKTIGYQVPVKVSPEIRELTNDQLHSILRLFFRIIPDDEQEGGWVQRRWGDRIVRCVFKDAEYHLIGIDTSPTPPKK